MNEQSQDFTEPGAAFQKIWLGSMSKLMQAAFTFSPNSTPPELLREIRNGILQALGETWNEFLRSPQFQENMKQCMENAVAFRKHTNDFMAKVHKEMQTPSRDDIDTIQLTVRHMETRILDRLEKLAKLIEELKPGTSAVKTSRTGAKAAVRQPQARRASRRRAAKTVNQSRNL
jgi:hypothetical protein